MSFTMSICPKCARFKVHRICPFCNLNQIETETTVEEVMSMSEKQKEELINYYIETLIKDTYDPKAREYREENEEPVFADYVPNSSAKCPTCSSTNIKKVSGASKAFSVAMFGLLSQKVKKTFHCNNCGYEW